MEIKDIIGIYPNAFKESECKALMYKLEEAVKMGNHTRVWLVIRELVK